LELSETVCAQSATAIAHRLLVRAHPPSIYKKYTSINGSASFITDGVFKTKGDSVAFSTREMDIYCICISDFMINEIDDISSWAFSCAEFMPVAGGKDRKTMMTIYSAVILLFIMLHEAGHIKCGHCDYFGLGRENEQLLNAVNNKLFGDKIGVDLLGINAELEVDNFAIMAMYADKTLKAIELEYRKTKLPRMRMVEFVTSAICMAFFYLCFVERRKKIDHTLLTNLPVGCRAIRFIKDVRAGTWLGDVKIGDEVVIDAQKGVRSIDFLASVISGFRSLHEQIISDYATYGAALDIQLDTVAYFNGELQLFRISSYRKFPRIRRWLRKTLQR
jgi:hypothetical protein